MRSVRYVLVVVTLCALHYGMCAPTYSVECKVGAISSMSVAVSLCSAANSVPATPISISNIATINSVLAATTPQHTLLGGYQRYSISMNTIVWIWASPSPHAGEIIWVQPDNIEGSGGYAPGDAFADWWSMSTYPSNSVPSNLTMHSSWSTKWFTSSGLASCVLCQHEPCSSACNGSGTNAVSGTNWPACTCVCKPGWIGRSCSRHIEVYSISVVSASQISSFCAKKGGFAAQPESKVEEENILRYVLAGSDATDINKPVVIGAYSSASDGTAYCYRDGPLNGECVVSNGSTTPGVYSDFKMVPNETVTFPLLALLPLNYSTGRWTSIGLESASQIACQFSASYKPPLTTSHTATGSVRQSQSESQRQTYSQSHSRSHIHVSSSMIVNTLDDSSSKTITRRESLVPVKVSDECQSMAIRLYRNVSINGTFKFITSLSITDADVRTGLLRVQIYPRFVERLTVLPSLADSIVISVDSEGVRDPRSFPNVVNTGGIVCSTVSTGVSMSVICAFPQSPDYTLRADETLIIRGSSSGVSPSCSDNPWTIGTINVTPANENVLLQIFQIASTLAASVATVVIILLADGTPIEVQVLIVLLNSVCASNVDRESVILVRYFISPAIHRGWDWVVGVNVVVAVAFAAIHTVAVLVVSKYLIHHNIQWPSQPSVTGAYDEGATYANVRARLLYPGLPLAVSRILYIGVACGTFDVLRTTQGPDAAIAALGILYLVAVPALDMYLLSRVVVVAYVPYERLGCQPPHQRRCMRWLYPKGVWGPTDEVRRYVGLIGPFRGGYRFGSLAPVVVSLTVALSMHALPSTIECDYLFVMLSLVLCVAGIATVAARPSRAILHSLVMGTCLICIGVLGALQIIAIRGNSNAVEAVKTTIVYVVVLMVLARSGHRIFIFYIERKWASEVNQLATLTTTPYITHTPTVQPTTDAHGKVADEAGLDPPQARTFNALLNQCAQSAIDSHILSPVRFSYFTASTETPTSDAEMRDVGSVDTPRLRRRRQPPEAENSVNEQQADQQLQQQQLFDIQYLDAMSSVDDNTATNVEDDFEGNDTTFLLISTSRPFKERSIDNSTGSALPPGRRQSHVMSQSRRASLAFQGRSPSLGCVAVPHNPRSPSHTQSRSRAGKDTPTISILKGDSGSDTEDPREIFGK